MYHNDRLVSFEIGYVSIFLHKVNDLMCTCKIQNDIEL